MNCGVSCRCGSDPTLLWLWRRPVATAPIRPLAGEPTYASGAAQEKTKRQKKKRKENSREDVLRDSTSSGGKNEILFKSHKEKQVNKQETN